MRNTKFLVALALLVVVVFSACSQPEEVAPPTTSGGLSTLSTDGEAEVGPDGGIIQSSDGSVTVTIPEDTVSESVEIQVGTVAAEDTGDRPEELPTDLALHSDVIVLAKYDDVAFEGAFRVSLNVAASRLEGHKVYVATWVETENRWRELSVDYAITQDFTELTLFFTDIPEVSSEDANLNLADLPPTEVEPALNRYTIAVIYASIQDEINRCITTGAEWMDLTLETGTPDGYCSAPIDTYWDALNDTGSKRPASELAAQQSSAPGLSTQVYTPSYRGDAFVLTANVGHNWGAYNCCNDMYKLSNAGAEQRIHDNLNSLKPDLLFFQELGNTYYWNVFWNEVTSETFTYHSLSTSHTYSGTRVQIERLIKDAGLSYKYVCSRYTADQIDQSEATMAYYVKGMAFECVAWNSAKFSYSGQVPFAIMGARPSPGTGSIGGGYSISYVGAAVQLQQSGKSKPIRVISVHTTSGVTASSASARSTEFSRFRSATLSSSVKTLWAGDFNTEPNDSGVDAQRLRNYGDWRPLISSDTTGEDFLKPVRSEMQTTAVAGINRNYDHLMVSKDVSMTRDCEVLYTTTDRLDYWNGSGGGMDHRAVACGTTFGY